MGYEVELKFAVGDMERVERSLVELGAESLPSRTEVDVYLEHPGRSFQRSDEALRIRTAAGRVTLTYKGPKVDRVSKTREEIELELVTDSQTPGRVAALLQRLGFRPVRPVRKSRRPFRLRWQGRAVTACLDEVDGLGRFLELETAAEGPEVAGARQALIELAGRLGLSGSERRSYLELLMAKDAADAAEGRPA